MIRAVLAKLVERMDLTEDEAAEAMTSIMSGKASSSQIAGFLTALRMKGETVDEIYALARTMRQMAIGISVPENTIDTCGTGGDGLSTFNISTIAAFVIAGAGVPVAKHGNRGVSSSCGSADVLEAVGVEIGLTPIQVEQCVNEVGVGFLFAPVFHKAMRHAIGPRQELGIRTIFNILGPLTNPANVKYQITGLFSPDLTEKIARVLRHLGVRHALVVHGSGLDELTTTGESKITELRNSSIESYSVVPEDFGLRRATLADLRGESPLQNRDVVLDILRGVRSPRFDIVVLNAGAGLYVADAVDSIHDGVELATQTILDGRAMETFESFRVKTVELAGRG